MTLRLTSTTAPGTVFASREDLAAHYQTDWHRYNLKRREAGLPVVGQADFEARKAAAQALRKQDEEQKASKQDHVKKNRKKKHFKKKTQNGQVQMRSSTTAYDRMKEDKDPVVDNDEPMEDSKEADESNNENSPSPSQLAAEAAIEIDPRQCLFDKHISATVCANVDRMKRKYGFFLPDAEALTDLDGLIGYCHEVIKLGHTCLYCQSVFSTWKGCQNHMISKRHCQLRYEAGVDMEDYAIFYDFTSENAEYLHRTTEVAASKTENSEDGKSDDADDDGWEDVTDDEAEEGGIEIEDNNDEDDELFEQLVPQGFQVTELGELILPDGRIVGHRSLKRYYKQRVAPVNNSTAVVAAREAAGERLYRGRVYQLGSGGMMHDRSSTDLASGKAYQLMQAGLAPALGRAGNGILVSMGSSKLYSQTSVYRYRAAIRKQRRGDWKGQRIFEKTNANINRMDKKANRLMNGVSVAHAAR